jgi:hypothetical protein
VEAQPDGAAARAAREFCDANGWGPGCADFLGRVAEEEVSGGGGEHTRLMPSRGCQWHPDPAWQA